MIRKVLNETPEPPDDVIMFATDRSHHKDLPINPFCPDIFGDPVEELALGHATARVLLDAVVRFELLWCFSDRHDITLERIIPHIPAADTGIARSYRSSTIK